MKKVMTRAVPGLLLVNMFAVSCSYNVANLCRGVVSLRFFFFFFFFLLVAGSCCIGHLLPDTPFRPFGGWWRLPCSGHLAAGGDDCPRMLKTVVFSRLLSDV